MHSLSPITILPLALLLSTTTASALKAPVCDSNDELRCFQQTTDPAKAAAGTAWCSSWIHVPAVTTTVAGYTGTSSQATPTAPDCIPTTDLSAYEKKVLSSACSCITIPVATVTVAPTGSARWHS